MPGVFFFFCFVFVILSCFLHSCFRLCPLLAPPFWSWGLIKNEKVSHMEGLALGLVFVQKSVQYCCVLSTGSVALFDDGKWPFTTETAVWAGVLRVKGKACTNTLSPMPSTKASKMSTSTKTHKEVKKTDGVYLFLTLSVQKKIQEVRSVWLSLWRVVSLYCLLPSLLILSHNVH